VQSSSASPSAEPITIVLIGPGGTGKGTVAERLVAADESLWLSKSWTTRPRREGEDDDAYVFVDRLTFENLADAGGFVEFAEFLGHLYGTPLPAPPPGHDVLLEIDVQGARQIVERSPGATVILLLPPSEGVQAARLRGRGDDEEHVARRLEAGRDEVAQAREFAHHEVVNDDLDQAVAQVASILGSLRQAPAAPEHSSEER